MAIEHADITQAPAHELARMIRDQRLSSVEVVEAHLARIDAVNPGINAVVQIAPDARDRARACDDTLARGEIAGPLLARAWHDHVALAVAAVLERALGGYGRRPNRLSRGPMRM